MRRGGHLREQVDIRNNAAAGSAVTGSAVAGSAVAGSAAVAGNAAKDATKNVAGSVAEDAAKSAAGSAAGSPRSGFRFETKVESDKRIKANAKNVALYQEKYDSVEDKNSLLARQHQRKIEIYTQGMTEEPLQLKLPAQPSKEKLEKLKKIQEMKDDMAAKLSSSDKVLGRLNPGDNCKNPHVIGQTSDQTNPSTGGPKSVSITKAQKDRAEKNQKKALILKAQNLAAKNAAIAAQNATGNVENATRSAGISCNCSQHQPSKQQSLPDWIKLTVFKAWFPQDDFEASTLNDLEQKFYDENLAISIQEAFQICMDTILQADCTYWKEIRKKLITASKVHLFLFALGSSKTV
jgi:hypothetical protein